MGSTPLAFSVHHFINSVGADAGFASIIGLAILILLYFAQARETASLRNHAYEAAQRIQELEARLAQLGRASAPPPAAPPISAARATAAVPPAGATPAPAVMAAGPSRVATVGAPVAPAGVAAPALTAATKLIPTPAPAALAPDQPPDATVIATPGTATPPATIAGGGNGATQAPPPVVPPGPAAAPVATQAPPPRMQIRPGATAAPGRRAPAPRPRGRRELTGTRIAMGLLGVLLVGGVVALLLVLTGNNSTSANSASNTTNASARKHAARRPAVIPARVNVAVLNGTATAGLANRVALNLSSAGYKRGTVTNATDQTRTSTTVAYLPGFRRDAVAVAGSLKLPASSVAPIDQPTESVACPPPAACAANVVVTVGSNLGNIP